MALVGEAGKIVGNSGGIHGKRTYSTLSRVCYGSDDFNAGMTRGKYIAWGCGWELMGGRNQTFNTDHCDGRMTFVRYEMLRAMRRAALNQRLTRGQIEDVFYNNAARLVEDVWNDRSRSLEANPEVHQ